jgi:hypothetical protein
MLREASETYQVALLEIDPLLPFVNGVDVGVADILVHHSSNRFSQQRRKQATSISTHRPPPLGAAGYNLSVSLITAFSAGRFSSCSRLIDSVFPQASITSFRIADCHCGFWPRKWSAMVAVPAVVSWPANLLKAVVVRIEDEADSGLGLQEGCELLLELLGVFHELDRR